MNSDNNSPQKIDVIQEQAIVDKQVIEKARVRVTKNAKEEKENIDIDVAHEEVEVTKIPVNKYVDTAPEVRFEGNTTIIPVLKEVLVVEKKILLVEEVHITKHTVNNRKQETISLLKEEVTVERINKVP
jgi:uncharacterized protein (TIGR02271 family)